MTVETKFKPGDLVFALKNNKVVNEVVGKVVTVTEYTKQSIHYELLSLAMFQDVYPEDKVFGTKQELLDSL